MINQNYFQSFWAFDQNGMVLENGDIWTRGDSLGRVAFFYIFHPNCSFLKETIFKCIKQRDDGYIQFYRYLDDGAESQSRDHVSAVILALWFNHDHDELKWILDNLPLQLSRRYWQTLDFWLWQKSLKALLEGEKVKYQIFRHLFLILNVLIFILTVPFNLIIKALTGVRSYDIGQISASGIEPEVKIKKWRRRLYQKLTYPTYALYNLAWMIKSLRLEDSILTSMLRLITKKDNLVIKQLLTKAKIITEEEYLGYNPINTFQWAGEINNLSIDRHIRRLTPEEIKYNDLTKANLDYLYYDIDKLNPRLIQEIKLNNSPIFY